MEKGARIDIKNSNNRSPLELANDGGHEEVESLLRNELLLDAVKRKDRSGVEAQLDKGANVNYVRREDGCAPCCQL
ncbi:hypothetical protein [Wolbachia endosymbiont (group A) of Bombylius major]|uniref:hypothetical protein n=1 Tax=unclassified Wolbachia TaxID=2640676 RepID=UPI003877A264